MSITDATQQITMATTQDDVRREPPRAACSLHPRPIGSDALFPSTLRESFSRRLLPARLKDSLHPTPPGDGRPCRDRAVL